MRDPDFTPERVEAAILRSKESKWRPDRTELRRTIITDVMNYWVAAGYPPDFDHDSSRELLSTLCAIYAHAMEVGWRYAQAEK